MKHLLITAVALLCLSTLAAQTINVSSNASQAGDPRLSDQYVRGGLVKLTFADSWFTQSGIVIVLTPSDPAIKISYSHVPRAYRVGDPNRTFGVSPVSDHWEVAIPPGQYSIGDSIVITGIMLDTLGIYSDSLRSSDPRAFEKALAGQAVRLSLSASPVESGITFTVQEVAISRVSFGQVAR